MFAGPWAAAGSAVVASAAVLRKAVSAAVRMTAKRSAAKETMFCRAGFIREPAKRMLADPFRRGVVSCLLAPRPDFGTEACNNQHHRVHRNLALKRNENG